MASSEVIRLHERLDAAKSLRNIADDIEEAGFNEVPVVVTIQWPDGVEVYAGGKIPTIEKANMILDFGKRRIIDLEYPGGSE